MMSRLFALLVWALVAGTGVFWGLRLFAQPSPLPTQALAVIDATAASADLSRLLGSAPADASDDVVAVVAPELSARFRLTGVMAPKRPSEQGLAVISVDGNPPRVYRVGAWIDGDLMLREVSLRTATVGSSRDSNDAATSFVLELPPVNSAATGVLPQIGISVAPEVPPDVVPMPGRIPRGVPTR